MSEFEYTQEFEEIVSYLVREWFGENRPLTREEKERFRGMTGGEKIKLSLQMTEDFYTMLDTYPVEVRNAVINEIKLERDMGNENMLRALGASKKRDQQRDHTPEEVA